MGVQLGSPFLGNMQLEGIQQPGQIGELLKALNAGSDTAPGGSDPSGYALRPESLERTLAIQTFKDRHVQFWKNIPKEAAFSTVEEYDRLESYGPERLSAFMSEGNLPVGDDASYSRQTVQVKYMGTLRVVSHQMGIVRSIVGDQVAQETRNGTLWLMRQLEKALFFGSSSLVDTQFDGVYELLQAAISSGAADASNLIDRRSSANAGVGTALDGDALDEASELVHSSPNFGTLDCVYYGTGAHRSTGTQLFGTARDRVRLNADAQKGGAVNPGWKFEQFSTLFGDLDMKPNVFLNPTKYTAAELNAAAYASGDVATRAGTPTLAVAEAGTDGLFGTETGVYKYIVVAVNSAGNSVGSTAASHTLTGGAKHVAVTITKGAGGTPSGYVVYRSTKGTTNYYEVARIAYATSPQTWNDANERIAGTSIAFAFTTGADVLAYKQLAPFMRIPLATITLQTRWAQILYGAPVLKSPRKIVVWKNVL